MTHRWTDTDDLLVIDLYLRKGALTADETEVRTVARLVGTSAESIASALANVRYLDTGQGLPNYAGHMKAMWSKWGHRPDQTKDEAATIRRRIEDKARVDRPALSPEQEARVAARVAERRAERRSR